jgi:hypothetical protein
LENVEDLRGTGLRGGCTIIITVVGVVLDGMVETLKAELEDLDGFV